MKIESVKTRLIQEVVIDGKEYWRLGENNWAEWMGESLEIVQFSDELEAAFLSRPIRGLDYVIK